LPLPTGKPVQGVIVEEAVPPTKRIAIDPGKYTGVSFFDTVAPDNEPVPWKQRVAFWERSKQRFAERRKEREEQRAREDMDISLWLKEKAPTGIEEIAQDTVDRQLGMFKQISAGSITADQIIAAGIILSDKLPEYRDPTPISSARSTQRQVATLETINVDEVFWDVTSMIDAHRNGATALERPLDWEDRFADTPVWEDVSSRLYDPTHEVGPRERDWIRKQYKEDRKK